MERSDGTPFGRYRLIERLGRGGMGEVWRAHDTRTKRIVAIKVLHPQFSDDPKFQLRFRREAFSAARIENPHVIPIHDYGEIDGRLYVDMRLIRGQDLHTVLTSGPIEPDRAVRIVEQVAKALHAAHQVGLVHRDVKPSNILLDQDDFAYLIDFGIAQAADDTRVTGTGVAIGTYQYMAPERMGDEADDARADIYALACVLYECLIGRPPFTGVNVPAQVAAHLNTPPPRPSNDRPELPPQLDAVIATGMAKNPDHRYATTVDFASAARSAVKIAVPRPEGPGVPGLSGIQGLDANPRVDSQESSRQADAAPISEPGGKTGTAASAAPTRTPAAAKPAPNSTGKPRARALRVNAPKPAAQVSGPSANSPAPAKPKAPSGMARAPSAPSAPSAEPRAKAAAKSAIRSSAHIDMPDDSLWMPTWRFAIAQVVLAGVVVAAMLLVLHVSGVPLR